MSEEPIVLEYLPPSILRRIVVGSLSLIILAVVIVVLPLWLLGLVGQHGVASSIPTALVLIGGAVIIVLNTSAIVTKFDRVYGPFTAASSAASLVYLLILAQYATIHYSSSGGGTAIAAAVDYSAFIRLLLIVPGLGVVSGVFMTMQDWFFPQKRLPLDFPVK
jgi:hypothetical protein